MDNRTVEILKRFDVSWSQTKARFDKLIALHEGFKRLVAVREFSNELEMAGGRQLYRLGTSVHILIISRSVDHGLRSDQKSIRVEAIATDDSEVIFRDGEKI